MNLDELANLIEEYSDDAVEFGDSDCDLSPSSERLKETKELLGCELPPSYEWFLKNYGGGEVYGEEIFSIYPILSEKSVGDVVYQTRWHREKSLVSDAQIVICSNDFGEIFYLDASEASDLGEYPVYIAAGEAKKRYADNFAEFLHKRIMDPEA